MKLSLKINRTVRKAAALAVGLALGLFASTVYAGPVEKVQDALNLLYPGQDWKAANIGDTSASLGIYSGLIEGTSTISTHPISKTSGPATLTRKGLITGFDPVLHLKVHSHKVGQIVYDWVLNVLVNDEPLTNIVVCSETSVDYRFSLAAYANKGEVTLQLQNVAGGTNPWYYETGYWDLIEIVGGTATWTSAADDGNPMNPANWACTNTAGAEVASAIPSNMTIVTIPDGCTNSFPTGKGFLAKEVKLPATLGADNLDWSGIAAPFSGTLDLQGRKLTVSQLAGNATIIDTTGLEYELLDSITSDRNKIQYIKTGMTATDNVKYVLDFGKYRDETVSNKLLLGLDSGDTYALGFLLQVASGKPGFIFWGGGKALLDWSNRNYSLSVDVANTSTGDGTVTLKEISSGSGASKTVTNSSVAKIGSKVTDTEFAIFGSNKGTQCSSYTLYRFWFKEASGAEHTFVPVRRISDGKCGILDLTAYQADPTTGFHGNANTAATSGDFTAGTVTNYLHAAGGIGTPGELHVNVAANTTNVSVALTGNLKLVKEGAGAFTAAKAGQSYVGGTEVEAGLINLPVGDTGATGGLGLTGCAIRVAEGATLDVNGNTGFKAYSVVLAGGMLRNGTAKSQDSADHQGTVGRITLEADSTEGVLNNLAHTDLIDLNEHTLTVQIGGSGQYYILNENGSFTNGTVDITNGGWFRNEGGALDMRTVNMRIKAVVHLENDVKVNDLELLYASNYGTGDGRFLIYGTYKAGNYHKNCVLQDGATLDLGGVADAWPVESTFSTSTPLAFEKDATITVSLGGRRPKNGPIVTWQEGNAPDTSVNFALDPALNARLVRKPDGLWLQTGFLIRIR